MNFKKIFRYSALLIFGLLWYLGFSESTAKWLFEHHYISDDYRYGDLYRLSNLSAFRVPVEKCPTPVASASTNTNLYLIGDSFTEKERLEKNHFKGLASFHRYFIADTTYINLDSTKKNILIIETVERHARERFANVYSNLRIGENLGKISLQNKENSVKKAISISIPYSTQRHEGILFSSDFFLTIKELKAWFNWKVLGRIDEKVRLSKDGKHILYYLDAQPRGINSCFDKVEDTEINKIVDNLNQTYEYYKKMGFDEVYLTIAPNKTSILASDLGKYNHLIERIQQHPKLQMPYFDVYTPFKNSKKMLYDIGDTHWNCEGKQIWLDMVNAQL